VSTLTIRSTPVAFSREWTSFTTVFRTGFMTAHARTTHADS
jgi:hypothetical protein